VKGTVKTPKGKFKVPGKAYIDGRDRDAKPPLTLRTVNVWSGAGRLQARERVVCEIKHGTKLSVTGAVRHTGEERYYFHAEAGGCSGWVPETFVGRKKYKRVGSWYP
jgi:hypothetical protein